MLCEVAFYLSMASEKGRAWWTAERLAGLAVVPYLLYAVPCGVFEWRSVAGLLALAAVGTYWFKVLPDRQWVRLVYLLVMAGPVLFPVFPALYGRIGGGPRLDFIGKLLWIRVGAMTVLRDVRPEGVRFGFWPEKEEWLTGAKYFGLMLPVLFPLTHFIGFARFTWPTDPGDAALKAVTTFVGSLWVVALSEEFLFRGLVLRWVGFVPATVLFGLAHLGFRRYPNWQMVALATVAGVFYGLAARKQGGIRAAMVVHTLTNVTWRVFFQ